MSLRSALTLDHRAAALRLSPSRTHNYDVTGWDELSFKDAVIAELTEVTAEDGTTRWQTLCVILPLIKPSTAAARYSALSRHGTTTSLQRQLPLMVPAEHFKSQSHITPSAASEWPSR
jgi:hypothetical protein